MSLAACPTCARHHDPATACPFCVPVEGAIPARLGGALLISAATTLGCVGGLPAGTPTPSPTASSTLAGSVPTPTPAPTTTPPSTTYGMPPPPRRRRGRS